MSAETGRSAAYSTRSLDPRPGEIVQLEKSHKGAFGYGS